jgi:hypothetical protein
MFVGVSVFGNTLDEIDYGDDSFFDNFGDAMFYDKEEDEMSLL